MLLMELITSSSDCRLASGIIDQNEHIPDSEGTIIDTIDPVVDLCNCDRAIVVSTPVNLLLEGNIDIGPHSGLEFDSHEAAYKFYQEYATSLGFTTSIKNSRRSKKSKDFIDAKFACSRYGLTPESEGSSSGTRKLSIKKTDCKASMHVKRSKSGKWIIHEFIKDHNHELLPALAYHFRAHRSAKLAEKNNIDILHTVSERTKRIYVEMSRQSARLKDLRSLNGDFGVDCNFDKGSYLDLDGDAQILLYYFMSVKKENPKFFYAINLNEDQRLRNIFWVDAKSRCDYISFCDTISLDTTYTRTNDKIPLVLFVGVNHHFQSMLLGCALIADDLTSAFSWLLKTWSRAMGGNAPRVILTDQHPSIKSAIQDVFPTTRHCFHLWNVLEKIPENLFKQRDNFAVKFDKCVFKSWSDEEFELRWWKMIGRFDLQDEEWVRSLYEDRRKWVPLYVCDTFLAGLSPIHRSESVNSFFDKYIQRKLTVRELVKQYGLILQNRYEAEAIADFDTWHKQPALKSPSPWEKQTSTIYTHAIFKRFQIEVLGVVGCHPKKESDHGGTYVTYRVEDCEKDETFFVTWDETNSQVSCLCRSFESKGILCRHAMIVLQISGILSIPSQYILKRWTKDAKGGQLITQGIEELQTRAQRYVSLSKQAIELSEEGSITQESYSVAHRALENTLTHCVGVNNSNNSAVNCNSESYHVDERNIPLRTNKKKNTVKKRKIPSQTDAVLTDAHNNMDQMENLSSGGVSLNGYYSSQQSVQGLVQLNLMEPPHDSYYVDQESMQGLGQLNSLGPNHEGFFGAQQSVHEMGHLDFRTSTGFSYNLQDEHNLRTAQFNGDASKHT